VSERDQTGVRSAKWFAVPLGYLCGFGVFITALLIAFGAVAVVLGGLAGGVFPSISIARRGLGLARVLLTCSGALTGAIVAGLLVGSEASLARVAVSLVAGLAVGLTLVLLAVWLHVRTWLRKASA